MSKNYSEQQQILLKNEYEKIFGIKNERPEWAVKRLDKDEIIHPTIPFVGKNYNNNEKKLLLYASAEVIKENHNGYLDKKENAFNRHRACFEESPDLDFFPCVHIGPIDDGGLVIVVAYILRLLKIKYEYNSPRELLENIALANFSKFTIFSKGKNKDIAQKSEKLEFSLNYVKKDLEILKPEIIVIPVKIYNKTPNFKKTIKTILPSCLVIPIYQINGGVVNRTIKDYYDYPQKDPADIGYLKEWQAKLKKFNGETNQNFYSVYTYLEDVIKRIGL